MELYPASTARNIPPAPAWTLRSRSLGRRLIVILATGCSCPPVQRLRSRRTLPIGRRPRRSGQASHSPPFRPNCRAARDWSSKVPRPLLHRSLPEDHDEGQRRNERERGPKRNDSYVYICETRCAGTPDRRAPHRSASQWTRAGRSRERPVDERRRRGRFRYWFASPLRASAAHTDTSVAAALGVGSRNRPWTFHSFICVPVCSANGLRSFDSPD